MLHKLQIHMMVLKYFLLKSIYENLQFFETQQKSPSVSVTKIVVE